MYELTNKELYQTIEYARNIDEETGRSVMEKFQIEQSALAQTIFNIFPSLIAQQNQGRGVTLFLSFRADILVIALSIKKPGLE